MKKLAALFFLAVGCSFAQTQWSVQAVTVAPTGSCGNASLMQQVVGTGLYQCISGTWTNITGGGAATSCPGCAITGDVTGTLNSSTVTKINGATVPVSTDVLGSNSSRQPIQAVYNAGVTGASGTVNSSFTSAVQRKKSVADFGAFPNDVDSTASFQNAIAWANNNPYQAALELDCSGVNQGHYLITGPIGHIATGVTIEAHGDNACPIMYTPTGASAAPIIDLVSSTYVTLKDFFLESTSASFPPQAGILLGRDSSDNSSGDHNIVNVHVAGYYTKGGIVNISSEIDNFTNVNIQISGGGATCGYYTAGKNYIGITGTTLTTDFVSNLTQTWTGSTIGIKAGVAADGVCDVLEERTGNHDFRGINSVTTDPTNTTNTNAAFHFFGGTTNPNSIATNALANNSISIGQTRIENFEYGVRFDLGLDSSAPIYQNIFIAGMNMTTSTAGGTIYCIDAATGVSLQNSSVGPNNCDQGSASVAPTSQIYNLYNSILNEPNYPVTIAGASYGNVLTVGNPLTFSLTGAVFPNIGMQRTKATFGDLRDSTFYGSLSFTSLATPVVTGVSIYGTGGSSSYSYGVVAIAPSGNHSNGSNIFSTGATANATLGSGNCNAVFWSQVEGAEGYVVYRTVNPSGSGSPNTGAITTTLSAPYVSYPPYLDCSNIGANGAAINSFSSASTVTGANLVTINTSANCSSAASPAVCVAAPSGNFVIAASATSVVVDTTAVTANSQILVTEDSSLGTKLGVTCNTGDTIAADVPKVTARTAGTSFTVTVTGTVTTNPACYSFSIIN